MRPRKGKENADCVSAEEKGILEVKFIDSYIGSGVFASDTIEKGQLVCYYEGELISEKDGIQRFNTPHDKGSFLFFFHHEGKLFCIDATHSSGCGRMINDDHRRPNCKVSLTGPKLAIYALKDVYKGDELRYDYKDTTAFWQRLTQQKKDNSYCLKPYLTNPVEKNEKTTEMDAGGESSVNNTAEDTIQETEQSKQSSQEKLTGPIEDDKIEETEVMDADGENSVNNTAEDTIQETEQSKQSSQEELHTAPVEDDKVEVTEEMDAGGESSVNNTAEDTIQETEQSKQSIISQMINLKENELDTFAGFLGHNIKVHREFDRLPEDTLQVAKISKILLEMERGNIHLFKGKSLDDIQLDQEEPLEEDKETEAAIKDSERDVGGESHAVATAENILETEQSKKGGTEGQTSTGNTVQNMRSERSKQGSKVTRVKVGRTSKKSANRKPWSGAEKEAVRRQLGKYFALDKLPGKHEIETAIRKEPVLCNRPWDHIKFFIKNTKISLSRNAIKNIFST